MARSHGILKNAVWDVGSDFRALTRAAQWAYVMLLSQPEIDNCGVVPYRPERWARFSADATRQDLDAAIAELADHRFVIVDADAHELLVRTFIKHDRVWRQPNLVKNARDRYQAIESDTIRDYLSRAHPWLLDPSMDAAEHESETPSETPSRETPSERGSGTPSGTPSGSRAIPRARATRTRADGPTPTPAPTPKGVEGLRSELSDAPPAPNRGAGASQRNAAAQNRTDTTGRRRAQAIADAEIAARNWNGSDSDQFARKLDAIAQEHRTTIPALERDRLWTIANPDPAPPPPDLAALMRGATASAHDDGEPEPQPARRPSGATKENPGREEATA